MFLEQKGKIVIKSKDGQNYYVMNEKIGSGASGFVSKCYRNGDPAQVYALKEIPQNQLSKHELQTTKQVIDSCKGKNFINFVQIYELIEQDRKIYIIMEFCNGRQFYQLCQDRSFYLSEKIEILKQIAHGIMEIHSINLIHRDLKPENVVHHEDFYQSSFYKICDIGVAKLANQASTCYVGTPYYMAPELLSNQEYKNDVDIWSFGCMIIEFLTGSVFFNGSSQNHVKDQILKFVRLDEISRKKTIASKIQDVYSPYFLEVLFYMLSVNPQYRPNAGQIYKHFVDLQEYLKLNQVPQAALAIKQQPDTNQVQKKGQPQGKIQFQQPQQNQQAKRKKDQQILINYDEEQQQEGVSILSGQSSVESNTQMAQSKIDRAGQSQVIEIDKLEFLKNYLQEGSPDIRTLKDLDQLFQGIYQQIDVIY